MRMLADHGADPRFVLHVSWVAAQGTGHQERSATTTALLASLGLTGDNGNRDSGGVAPWVPVSRAEREPLTLETVKTAVELGVDVNATSNDGRTALDAARNLKYEGVVKYLVEKGAKPGTGAATGPQDRGRPKQSER
jgi:hypothetical protein